jgi:hypothetical protein
MRAGTPRGVAGFRRYLMRTHQFPKFLAGWALAEVCLEPLRELNGKRAQRHDLRAD